MPPPAKPDWESPDSDRRCLTLRARRGQRPYRRILVHDAAPLTTSNSAIECAQQSWMAKPSSWRLDSEVTPNRRAINLWSTRFLTAAPRCATLLRPLVLA